MTIQPTGILNLLYFFDNYTLDPDRRELRSGATVIAMEPQVFDLLVYLIRHREHVVSRDDLMESIWGGRIVSKSALSTRINAARSAIGDSGTEQRLIKTLPRKGVRFVGEVREERKLSEATSISPLERRAVEIIGADRTAEDLPVLPLTGTEVIDGHSEALSPAVPAPSGSRRFSAPRAGRCGDMRFISRDPDMGLLRAIRRIRTKSEYRDGRKADPDLRRGSYEFPGEL